MDVKDLLNEDLRSQNLRDQDLTMDLLVNGKSERLAVATVADLLGTLDLDTARKGIAVAVNGAVVPRRNWAATALASGDAVEIIHAKQGG